jgi:hypothetical protein
VAQVQRPAARAEGLRTAICEELRVYTWIWRKLPGGTTGKIVGATVLFLAVVALLFFVVFPWVEPRLPLNDVTVNHQ